MRTALQVAAGTADIPVTRLLGQSPAGLSATGDSDTRIDYDMISSRQELDLRPQLERLDALLERSAGVEPGALRFGFRPLWQMSATERAGVALQKAQATAIYAGLQLWPAATTAALVRSQLIEDGTYPSAAAAFEAGEKTAPVADYAPSQPRDPDGRWSGGGSREAGANTPEASAALTQGAAKRIVVAAHIHEDPLNKTTPEDEEDRHLREDLKETDDPIGGPRFRPDGTVTTGMPALSPSSTGGGAGQHRAQIPPIKVKGLNPQKRGLSYEQGIRDTYGSRRSRPIRFEGFGIPDDVVGDTAIEVKYSEDFSSSPMNPHIPAPYPHSAVTNMIDQARRYATGFKGGVTFYTNSQQLADAYIEIFRSHGIENFRFIIVPSSR